MCFTVELSRENESKCFWCRRGREVVHDDAVREERRGGEYHHRRVYRPADPHGEERVEELVAQSLADDLLALLLVVDALDHLGVHG